MTEGRQWLARALALDKSASAAGAPVSTPPARLRRPGRLRRRSRLLEQARPAAVAAGDVEAEAAALRGLGNAAQDQGRYDEAERFHRQALEHFEAAGDKYGIASCEGNLAAVAYYRGDFDGAARGWTRALQVMRALGSRRNAMMLSAISAPSMKSKGITPEPIGIKESLDGMRASGDELGIASSAANLGSVLIRFGELDDANRLLTEALTRRGETGRWRTAAITTGSSVSSPRSRATSALRWIGR